MRSSLYVGFLLAMTATAAFAQAEDWTGAYGGLSMATNDGSHEYDGSGVTDYDLEGPSFGAFGGYLWGNGNLVYGGEGAITLGGVYEVDPENGETFKDEYEYDRFLDLKGRVGYATGGFLVYGALGVSRARFQSDIEARSAETINTTGMIYGLGADYRLGDRYFAGAEYMRRAYDFYDPGQDVDIDSEIDTFSLRIGMKF